MSRSQKNDNFIDKTFTILADVLVKLFPATEDAKKAFTYYREGMAAQAEGEYAQALECYYNALQLEEDVIDRSYIIYNIGLIYASNGEDEQALEYYHQALALNPRLVQALNNIAVIYHKQAMESKDEQLLQKAAAYWRKAIQLAPGQYLEAQNWLKNMI
jgi:tetratricopeptide (TPR) repeat protein|uniref:Photosystem I assembly protein Ycf3 n=1 Tax=Cyanidiaceae sp. MX-AZ01 TaxID=1503164 RepID=A0A060AE83_9RHOD|nr:photosystem I assembly protein Ycf3 [Cyanidiaceae sp. MX-AZ01]UNJ15425.1 photosystem I assembly protein Ycf3 [Cyanidioschyzonaceae sp. 1]